jgi:hypothetical protein
LGVISKDIFGNACFGPFIGLQMITGQQKAEGTGSAFSLFELDFRALCPFLLLFSSFLAY